MVRLFFLIPLITLTFACGAIFSNPMPPRCNYTLSPFGGGSGTVSDPYAICTVAHLSNVQNYLSSSFKQYADLDLAGNTSFTPIGSTTTPFTGNYDGGGRKISNWNYGDATMSNVGLFGVVSGPANISNIHLENVIITASANIGPLIGIVSATAQVSDCSSTGQVSSSGFNSGGLIGVLSQGVVKKCSSSVKVNGFATTGGLVGTATKSSQIMSSFATGAVNSSRVGVGINASVGGLVGSIQNGTTISDSYATGEVSGNGNSGGGLVGIALTGTDSTITNSYSSGNVTLLGSRAGGLVGYVENCSIMKSYATGSVSGSSSAGGLVGYLGSTSPTVSQSYSTGSVQANGTSGGYGGLIGRMDSGIVSTSYSRSQVTGSSIGTAIGGLIGRMTGNLTNSYAVGSVNTPNASNVGGLIGICSTCAVTSSYWDTQTSGQLSSAGSEIGKTTSEMQTQSSFSGWNFTTIWNPPSSGNYPTLR